MSKKDNRIDAYIARSADHAKPVLKHLRSVVHKACPEVTETIKWGFPHFEYKGILCSMASFKNHSAFGFWKGSVMKDPRKILSRTGETSMGHFGRITGLKDLPADNVLTAYIHEAMELNDRDVKAHAKPRPAGKKELEIPSWFLKTLKKNKKALATFVNLSYSNKKDYVEWAAEAKTDETREKRMATAVEWMAEGKPRNWKYSKKS